MKLGDRVTVTAEVTAAQFFGKTGTVSHVLPDGAVEVAIDWLRLHPIRFGKHEVTVQERGSSVPKEES